MSIDVLKQRILDKVPLADLIGENVSLKLQSGRPVGLCPFHQEKSPSFTIFEQHYFCFGCRAGGDAINYVRQTQGLSFMEALRYLAQKYSIEASELEDTKKSEQSRQHLTRLYSILQESQSYFSTYFQSQGEYVKKYLQNRGFSPEQQTEYGFGFAPDIPKGLVKHLLAQGHGLSDAIEASVATQSMKNRQAYDFYRNRLMIPIHDHHGRLVGFGGRAMGDDPAKYKNSRESKVFDKSEVLYGLHKAKEAIRTKKRAIVVEGYMDVLQLWNGGFKEAIACLGTALTSAHTSRLSHLTDLVYLVFDGDEAGKKASLRAVDMALDHPKVQFKVVRLDPGVDPDSLILNQGPEAFEAYLSQAKDLLEFAITSRVQDTHALGIPDLIQSDIIPWLKKTENTVQRSYLTKKVAEFTGVSEDSIQQLLYNKQSLEKIPMKRPKTPPPKTESERPQYSRKLTNIEYDFIGHIYFAQPSAVDLEEVSSLLSVDLELEPLWHDLCREFLRSLKLKQVPASQDIHSWRQASHIAVINLLKNLLSKQEAFATEDRNKALKSLGTELRVRKISQSISTLKVRLDQANREHQHEILLAIAKLNSEKRNLGM